MDGSGDAQEDGDVRVECQNCGYVWDYSGEMWTATCPSCGRKTRTPHHEDYEGD